MLAVLALFSSVLAAQGQLTGLSLSLLDSNGTAAAEGEVPASLVIGFTTTAANAATATVTLPSGMLSDGTMSFPARRLQEDPDEADWSGRVLATPTCEPYGTATVSSNVLTFSVRKVGTASDPCDAGATLSTTLTGNTASFSSPATGALAFTVATDTDSVPVSVTVIVDNTGTYTLSVVGDPITWYGGKKIKFWFPPQKLLPLMTTPEMTIWASTFQGPTIDYQWFDRFVVTDLEGHELVDVSVRRASADSNRSDFRIGDFKQLNIRMAGKLLRRRSSQLFSGGRDVKVGVGSRVVDPPRVHHSRLLEFVLVTKDEEVKQVLDIGEAIGRGSFGTVHSAKLCGKGDHPQVAVKISKRSKESGPRSFGDLDCLDRRIVSNWLFMNKPNVTHVYQVLVSPTFLYVVMEQLDGPDLSDWMLSEEGQGRSELSAMRILYEILQAAREVHRHGFVHRDLKFDNFRFAHGPKSELKLVDVVGTMCFRPDRLVAKSWCGTGPFLSPEALLGDVSPAVDMWAIGVMAFTILSGDLPFQADSLSELREAHAHPLETEHIFSHVSPKVKSLVMQLLDPDQEKRLTVDQALELFEIGDGLLCSDSHGRLPLAKIQRVRSQSWSFCPDMKPPEVKTLYLIRHGEAVHNIQERQATQSAKAQAMMEGLTPSSKEFQQRVEAARRQVLLDETLHDAALSPSGKMQALDALAEIKRLTMQGYPQPTAIYVSPLQRTLQTAAILFPEHPGIHVREELRERRTGLPCDERQRADLVAMRQTFNFMSFDELRSHDRHFRRALKLAETQEDKEELRGRTALLEALMRDQVDCRSMAVVTHKGYLRELERGPLQNPEAKEFGNCEVRVYQVTLPAEGGMMAKKLHG